MAAYARMACAERRRAGIGYRMWGGELSLKIAERGCEVSGIDMSESGIKHAKHLAEREGITCEFVVGSA